MKNTYIIVHKFRYLHKVSQRTHSPPLSYQIKNYKLASWGNLDGVFRITLQNKKQIKEKYKSVFKNKGHEKTPILFIQN